MADSTGAGPTGAGSSADVERVLAFARRGLSPLGDEGARVRARIALDSLAEPPTLEPSGQRRPVEPVALGAAADGAASIGQRVPDRAGLPNSTAPLSPLSPLSGATPSHATARRMPLWAALKAAGWSAALAASALAGAGVGVGFLIGQGTVETAPVAGPSMPSLAPPASTPIASPAASPEFQETNAVSPIAETPAVPVAPTQGASRSTVAAKSQRPGAATASPSVARHQPTASDARLERELSLLARAERALRRDDAELASALLDKLDAEQPATALGNARAAARVLADCQRKLAHSAERGAAFSTAHPESVYAERIVKACGLSE
jgi:hypothetical protein